MNVKKPWEAFAAQGLISFKLMREANSLPSVEAISTDDDAHDVLRMYKSFYFLFISYVNNTRYPILNTLLKTAQYYFSKICLKNRFQVWSLYNQTKGFLA